jgi:hypothetical protein
MLYSHTCNSCCSDRAYYRRWRHRYLRSNRTTLDVQPKLYPISFYHPIIVMTLTLEIACIIFSVAGKCNLRSPPIQNFNNLNVRDIAHLMILFYYLAILIADSSFILGHQSIAGLVIRANIAIDACPPIFALTEIAISYGSIISVRQRPAYYPKSVFHASRPNKIFPHLGTSSHHPQILEGKRICH